MSCPLERAPRSESQILRAECASSQREYGKCRPDGLIALPALIDPHVHFRVPGGEEKEDWIHGARAALRGGVTTVCDMPNTIPPCTTVAALEAKRKQIDAQLAEAAIPLRYGLYLGADSRHLDQIVEAGSACVAVKLFMGCSTGGMIIEEEAELEETFRLAAEAKKVLAVHAEEGKILEAHKRKLGAVTDPAAHSQLRPKEAAVAAVTKALRLAARYQTTLYLTHVTTREEVELIRAAKQRGITVYAEVTPHHLFLTVADYAEWGTLVQTNPPLRTQDDQDALWEGIHDGTIDTVGSDHAPHTYAEKCQPFGRAPSGVPGIEMRLPLLLHAVHQGRLSWEALISLTSTAPRRIFSLPPHDDYVLVDMREKSYLSDEMVASKCGWTPYRGRVVQGRVVRTVIVD